MKKRVIKNMLKRVYEPVNGLVFSALLIELLFVSCLVLF